MRGLGLRRRLLVAIVLAVTVAIVGLVAGFNVIVGNVLDRAANNLVRSRAAAQLESVHTQNGRLSVVESPDDDRAADAFLWVFTGRRPIEQPRTSPRIDRAARSLAAGPTRFLDVPKTDTRLYAMPVRDGARRVGTVVAGVSLAAYEQTRELALLASLVFGAIVLILVAVAAWWLLGAALRPVARMTRQAAEWSEHDVVHRFSLGPPHDELTELAATLDALLDRVASSLRHERRFSAELSHELRTPLARVLAESELTLRREREPEEYREALELIRRSADQLARTVDALVAAARYESGGERGTADAHAVAESVARACGGLAAQRSMAIDVAEPGARLRIGLDADLAERILQPVIENACRYGSHNVHVSLRRENASVLYAVEDDGPGVTPEEQERIFEPGARGEAQRVNGGAGAGLGLALARRLARSVDGDIAADADASGGRFLVRLPTG